MNLLLVLYQFKNYKLVSYKLVSLQGQADDLFFGVERAVPGNMSVIGAGHVCKIYERAMKSRYADYVGRIFEKMCKEYLLRYADGLPILLREVGQWWGRGISLNDKGKVKNDRFLKNELNQRAINGILNKDNAFYR